MKILLVSCAILISALSLLGQTSDSELRRVIAADKGDSAAAGSLKALTAAEHLARAEAYSANRMFPEAREHWQAIFDNFPTDAAIPKALFGTARSYMWERKYAEAVHWFDKLTKDHLGTKEGREGLAFTGASYVRLGKNIDAARTYERYVTMFPNGERIESAHLNIIDAYREARKYDQAEDWIDRTVKRFAGMPTEVNALHARVRMEIFRERWPEAVAAANVLLGSRSFGGSMATVDEAKYLKGFALERIGKKNEAAAVYDSISPLSYFGGIWSDRRAASGILPTGSVASRRTADYPIPFRSDLVREAKKHKIDPRFLLAIMKQESSFRPGAKSPAGARGLLQLVFDTALKYNAKAGYQGLMPDDLYQPAVNIAVGSVYVAELRSEFDGFYEAIAASYNAGEDNAARWMNRSRPRDPGVFAAEVGFAETKNYVFKVMNNYRAYRELYTEDLTRK